SDWSSDVCSSDLAPDERSHNRGTHSRLGLLLLAGFKDRPIRKLNSTGQRPGIRGNTLKRFSHLPIVSGLACLAEVSQKDVHSHLARHFTGSLSSHAITDNKNP